MAEIPIPSGYGVPLVDLSTHLLPSPVMTALDARYEGGGGGSGTVTRVAGKSPDPQGNVALVFSDIGAAPAGDYATSASLSEGLATKAALSHTHTQAQVTGLPAALSAKADLVGGFIPTSQIPAIAITSITVVANQAAMLALNVQAGDVAKRTDLNGIPFMLGGDGNPATLANWISLDGSSGVTVASVNGQTGVVVLGPADVGAQPAGSYAAAVHTHAQADVTGLATALGLKTDKTYVDAQVASVQRPVISPVNTIGDADPALPIGSLIVVLT